MLWWQNYPHIICSFIHFHSDWQRGSKDNRDRVSLIVKGNISNLTEIFERGNSNWNLIISWVEKKSVFIHEIKIISVEQRDLWL